MHFYVLFSDVSFSTVKFLLTSCAVELVMLSHIAQMLYSDLSQTQRNVPPEQMNVKTHISGVQHSTCITLHSECWTAIWGNNKQNKFWAEGAIKEKTRNIILIFNIAWHAIIWLLGKELNSH